MTGEEYSATRRKLGLTQEQLAAAVGVALSTIQAREQKPEKDVKAEAAKAIEAMVGDQARAAEVEAGAG